MRQATAAVPVVDVRVENHGSVLLFQLLTDEAKAFVEAYVQHERMYFGKALVVEPRYAEVLVEGMRNDGLVVV